MELPGVPHRDRKTSGEGKRGLWGTTASGSPCSEPYGSSGTEAFWPPGRRSSRRCWRRCSCGPAGPPPHTSCSPRSGARKHRTPPCRACAPMPGGCARSWRRTAPRPRSSFPCATATNCWCHPARWTRCTPRNWRPKPRGPGRPGARRSAAGCSPRPSACGAASPWRACRDRSPSSSARDSPRCGSRWSRSASSTTSGRGGTRSSSLTSSASRTSNRSRSGRTAS